MNTRHVLGTPVNAIELTCTISVIAAVLGSLAYFAWFWHPGLSQCDTAIAKTLKAPSTYKRISAEGSGGSYEIEYDAANSYGVPLRGRGHCFATSSEASWHEKPDVSSINIEPDDLNDEAAGVAAEAAEAAAQTAMAAEAAKPRAFPYVTSDGVDIMNAEDEANWKKFGTTTPDGGE